MTTLTPHAQPLSHSKAFRASATAAYQRATLGQLTAIRVADGVYDVPSAKNAGAVYTVTLGATWAEWTCNCMAGANGRYCKHAAVAAKAQQAERQTANAVAAFVEPNDGARAHCTVCGAEYAYSDATYATRSYCPSCR